MYFLISLGFIILINIYIIIHFFNLINNRLKNVEQKSEYNINLILKIIEIISISLSIYFSNKYILKNKFSSITIDYITFSLILFVAVLWLFINYINPVFNIKYGYEINSNTSNNTNNTSSNTNNTSNTSSNNKTNSKKHIFSKYIDKLNKYNNYSFEDLYPDNINNDDKKPKTIKKKIENDQDYKAYNGYPPSHICYKCECLRKKNSNSNNNSNNNSNSNSNNNSNNNKNSNNINDKYFCGKVINGTVYGCDENWGCRNCKNCANCGKTESKNNVDCRKRYKRSSNFGKSDSYDCKSCKCYEDRQTINGYKCGRQIAGVFWKCRDDCDTCSKCRTTESNHVMYSQNNIDFSYKVVDPISKLDNVIIDDIKNFDYDGYIENNLTNEEIDEL